MLYDYNVVIMFLLVFARIAGMMFTAPLYSSGVVSSKVKLFFTFMVTMVIYASIPKPAVSGVDFFKLTALVIQESMIGIFIGFMMSVIFSAVQVASEIYSTSLGFNMVSVLDPLSESQTAIIGQFNYLYFSGVLIISGVHREVIKILVATFYKYPIGELVFRGNFIVKQFIEAFNYMFVSAIQMAIPIMGVLLMIDIVLGIMARIAPQMNVYFIGMPLKIMVGLYLMMMLVPYLYTFFKILIDGSYQKIAFLIAGGFVAR